MINSILEKLKLNKIDVLIPKVLTNSNISHGEFNLINSVLK